MDKVEIDIAVTGEGAGIAALDRLGGSAERLEKASAGTRLAMWGVGEQAGDLARSIGIPNQMARKLENTVESLATSLGRGAMVFGAVGLAITAGVAAWNYYNDAQKKAREETLKAADASMKWIDAAKLNTIETRELAAAKDELFQIEKAQNILALEKGINAQTDAIIKQFDEVSKKAGIAKTSKGGWQGSIWNDIFYGSKEEREAAFNDATLQGNNAIAQLKIMYAQLAIAKGGGLARGGAKGSEEEKVFDLQKMFRDKGYANALLINEKIIASDAEVIEKRIAFEKLKADLDTQALDRTLGGLKMIADGQGKHGREAFSAFKVISIARTTAAGIEAAVQAWKSGMSTGGWYLAAAYTAASVLYTGAQINQLKNLSYGGGSGGSGAIGAFSANPSTGLPTGGSGGGSITINVNGQKVGEYKQIAGGVLQSIYENNGNVGGFSIMVERHA